MPALENAKHEAACLAYLADRERIGWRAYRSARIFRSSPRSFRQGAMDVVTFSA
jgi:hypothetical protein